MLMSMEPVMLTSTPLAPLIDVSSRGLAMACRAVQSKVDSLVVIPNDRIKHVTDQKITFANGFQISDDVLRQALLSISSRALEI